MNNVILEQSYLQIVNEAAKKFNANTAAILNKLYSKVEENMKSSSVKNAYKKCVSLFIERRSTNLYDSVPCARLLFGQQDAQELFDALKISKEEVANVILQTYYGNEPNFSPLAAKDEFTVLMMCLIRYFYKNNMMKEAELAVVHLSFSGKFYPSLHYRSFQVVIPARHIMEYTINNVLSVKFDIVSEGSVIGAVRKIGMTWFSTYKDRLKKFQDEDVVYMISQLYSRIGSFMNNIARAYYDTWEKRDDLYLSYASDSVEEDNFHIADSDSLKINKVVEKTINYMTGNGVDYAICKASSDSNITTNEIRSIMESLLSDPESTVKIKEIVMLMVVAYMNYSGSSDKDVVNPKFITYSIAPKPNAKQSELKRLQTLIEELLSDNSPAYIRRKSRLATKNSFEKAIKMYFALSIHNANR